MAMHARPTRSWTRPSIVAIGVVALLGFGTSIGYAAEQTTGSVIHACFKSVGGALAFHPGSGACPAGSKPISWNAKGPAGPPGVADAYVGQASYPGVDGKHIHGKADATLLAETPKLPSGAYVVDSSAQLLMRGKSEIECFLAVVSINPRAGSHWGYASDTDDPDFSYSTLAVDNTFPSITKGDRIGFYCETTDPTDGTDYGAIMSVDMNAVRVHSVRIVNVK